MVPLSYLIDNASMYHFFHLTLHLRPKFYIGSYLLYYVHMYGWWIGISTGQAWPRCASTRKRREWSDRWWAWRYVCVNSERNWTPGALWNRIRHSRTEMWPPRAPNIINDRLFVAKEMIALENFLRVWDDQSNNEIRSDELQIQIR